MESAACPSPSPASVSVPPLLTTELTTSQALLSRAAALSVIPHIHNLDDAAFVSYHHRAFGSPSISTFIRAISKGRFPSLRRLTVKLVRLNPPLSPHTSFGHLDLIRKNLHSTRKLDPPSTILGPVSNSTVPFADKNFDYCAAPLSAGVLSHTTDPFKTADARHAAEILTIDPTTGVKGNPNIAYSRSVTRQEWACADLTGRFPVKSRRGNEYVLLTAFHGYVHVEPMKSKNAPSYVKAFKSTFDFFRKHGQTILHLISDNETSTELTAYFHSLTPAPEVHFVPPNNHRANPAERHIRTFKNHFIAMMTSVHVHFPTDLWDHLLPQAELTLNHLRDWTPDPSKSAYAGLFGKPVDFNKHPLHPPGQLVVAHDSPTTRPSWAPHGQRGYTLGPMLLHHRCTLVYIVHTGATRVCDTLDHFPCPLFHFECLPNEPAPTLSPPSRPAPKTDGSDLIGSWFHEPDLGVCQVTGRGPDFVLHNGAGNRVKGQKKLPAGYHHTLKYRTVDGIERSSVTEVADWISRFPHTPSLVPPTAPAATTIPPRRSPRLNTTPTVTPVLSSALTTMPSPPPCMQPHDDTAASTKDNCVPSYGSESEGKNPSRTAVKVVSPANYAAVSVAIQNIELELALRTLALASAGVDPPTPEVPHHATLTGSTPPITTVPLLNLTPDGKPLTYPLAISGPDSEAWLLADCAELRKLFITLRCLIPTMHPASKPTYFKRVVKEKWNHELQKIKRRVRGTVGGDRISVPYPCSTATASMSLVKMVLNAVVSEAKHFGTIDIVDYYLGADLPADDRPSLKIYLDRYPPHLLSELGLDPFTQKDKDGKLFVYADIIKTVAGLPQSGLLSQLRLISHLNSCGYYETSTPMLFRHETRDITFVLTVDDFGVKYEHLSDYTHLVDSLSLLYQVTVEPVGKQYLGFDINYDESARIMTLSLPGYIAKLLATICPDGCKFFDSPSVYEAPIYGSTAPQTTTVDSSDFAPPTSKLLLQQVVGSILYYARAVDSLMLTAVCELSTLQAKPTLLTMKKMWRLVGYAAKHPNGCVHIVPSEMLLRIQSDGSHLSRPHSKSVAGGIHYLGTTDPFFLNAPIHVQSTTIPVNTAAVSETEYAGCFANGQIGTDERSVLKNLGYPQPPTIILCDNECAVGLASDTVRAKKSKAIDMRFDWIRDRVRQKQFIVSFLPGSLNLADFFTKSLPKWKHQELAPLYVDYPPLSE